MKSISDSEYLELLQQLVEHQYNDAVDDDYIYNMEWIPAEPEIRHKLAPPNYAGMVDLTTVQSSKIKEELLKCGNVRIGSFKIRITRYNGVPSQQGAQICMDLEVMEEKTKTPNGFPCRIDSRADFSKDNRFMGRPWLQYFGNALSGVAYNVPVDTVVDIVRWMQCVKKLSAFL